MTSMPVPKTQLAEMISDQWGLSLHVSGCTHCKQIFLIEESDIGKICPYCFRRKLENQSGNIRTEPPELMIPYRIKNTPSEGSPGKLQLILSKFTHGILLHTKDFNSQSLLQRARKVYMPMWLVDCTLNGSWEAKAGYDYKVESSQDNFVAGKWNTNKVIETRIRWEPRLGRLKRAFNNIAVPGIRDQKELGQLVGGFDIKNAQPYQKELIMPSFIRNPDLETDESFPLAQSHILNAAADKCREAAGANHIHNFTIDADYESINWTQLLLPYYSTYYFDDQGNPQGIWINGESGMIGGPRLASQRKGWIWAGVFAGVALFLFLLALGFFALTVLLPPLAVVGTILVIVAIVVGLFAIIPAVYPWLWNRKQLDLKIHS